MTIPSKLIGITYSANINQPVRVDGKTVNTVTYLTFSSTDLELLGSKGSCDSSNGPLGTISRYSADPKTFLENPGDTQKVGNYYYEYVGPQIVCLDDNTGQKIQTDQVALMKQAFNSMKIPAAK